jgi:2-iminoacetate synthase
MTLREYLDDYASPETREIGMKMILAELDNIPNPKVREIVERNLSGIDAGARDFRF